MKSLLKRIGPMILLAAISGPASAQQAPTAFEQPPFTLPDDVSVRRATIWSEGTRLSAHLIFAEGRGRQAAHDHHGVWLGWHHGAPSNRGREIREGRISCRHVRSPRLG
jgi:hypothetical protein